MIQLRASQIDEMLQTDEPGFINKVLQHILEECPSRLPLRILREMIANGLVRARSHGLHTTAQLTAFVTLMFGIAPNFDMQPRLRAALEDSNVPIDERWERLFTPEFDVGWEAAGEAEFHDGSAWFPELKEEEEAVDGF